MSKYRNIISSFIAVVLVSCDSIYQPVPEFVRYKNDVLWKITDCTIIHSDGSADRSYSYADTQKGVMMSIYKNDNNESGDTLIYDIYPDSIICRNPYHLMCLDSGLVICRKNFYGNAYCYHFEYDDNRRMLRKVISKDGFKKGSSIVELSWCGKRITGFSTHSVDLSVKYNETPDSMSYGMLAYFSWELFDRQDIPFILMGYYGVISEGDVTSIDISRIRNEDFISNHGGRSKFIFTFNSKYAESGYPKVTYMESDYYGLKKFLFDINDEKIKKYGQNIINIPKMDKKKDYSVFPQNSNHFVIYE